jgi:hypothetical protein
VPEQALHVLNRRASRVAERGKGMPEVVEPKTTTAGRPSEPTELCAEIIGRPWTGPRIRHDELVVGVLASTGDASFGFVFTRHFGASRCDRHEAPRGPQSDPVGPGLLQRLKNVERGSA